MQQPDLWSTTVEVVRGVGPAGLQTGGGRVLITGAGTSAYAAQAISAAWPNSVAVPTTDLLVDPEQFLPGVDTVLSLARSGDSPESVAVATHIRELRPQIRQVAILCNREGTLARAGMDQVVFLDPRCNDRSLVMTSAFTNLVLAGLLFARPELAESVNNICAAAREALPEIDAACRRISDRVRSRLIVLASTPLSGWSKEAGLKCLEMCAGKHAVLTETFLGVRHGPMSFIKEDSVVICLLSSDRLRRAYELDLVEEFRRKNLGYLVAIDSDSSLRSHFADFIPAVAPALDDRLRTPFESIGPQLLGLRLSQAIGLNPDEPSPGGIINRVVEEFPIHPPR